MKTFSKVFCEYLFLLLMLTSFIISFATLSVGISAAEVTPYNSGDYSTSVAFDQQIINPLDLSPDILMVIRIANLQELGGKVDLLIQSIAPYPDAISIDTLQAIGNYLRNPGLDNISKNAFFELLLFVPRENHQSPIVVAFPVKEPQTYIRLLSNRTTMSSQIAPDGIIHLREQNLVTTDFYLCTTSKRIAIFGQNREAVSKARALYENSGESLSPVPTGDVELYLHLKKLMSIYSGNITTAFEQLHHDLVADLTSGRAGLAEPAGRLLEEALVDLKGLAEEISKIHLVLEISKDSEFTDLDVNDPVKDVDQEIFATAEINFETGNISRFLGNSVSRTPKLLPLMPAQTISLEWSSHENQGLRQIIDGLAGVIESGLNEPVDSGSSDSLDNIFALFMDLGITEMVSGTIESPGTDTKIVPSHIILAELAEPTRFKLFLDELQIAFADDSSLISLLNRNRIAFNLERKPAHIGDLNAEIITYSLKITGKEEPGEARPLPVNFSESYYVLLADNILACANGPDAENLLIDFAKAVRQEKSAFESSLIGGCTINSLKDERLLWASIMAPIPYINMALQARQASPETMSADNTNFNREFPTFSFPAPHKLKPPFLITLTPVSAGRLYVARVTLALPYSSLRQVMQALLVDNSENE